MSQTDITKQIGESWQNVVDKGLAKDRITHYTGAIDGGTSHYLGMILRYHALTGKEPITVYLNTPGGEVIAGLALYDLIQDIKKTCPVNIIATGQCCSLGPFVLQAASERLATPNTVFLLHEIHSVHGGRLSDLEDQQRFLERTQGTLNKVISERMGISEKQLIKLFARKDYYMSAEEALAHHLIDGIVKP